MVHHKNNSQKTSYSRDYSSKIEEGYLLCYWNQCFICSIEGKLITSIILSNSNENIVDLFFLLQNGQFSDSFFQALNQPSLEGIHHLYVESSAIQLQFKPIPNLTISVGSLDIFRRLRGQIRELITLPPKNILLSFQQEKLKQKQFLPETILSRMIYIYSHLHTTKLFYQNKLHEISQMYNLPFPSISNFSVIPQEKFIDILPKNDSSLSDHSKEHLVNEIKLLNTFSPFLQQIEKEQECISKSILQITSKIAPNLNHLLGPLLTAKFIARAHGLSNLAVMSAGKIQLLGSKKPRIKAKSPKFGLLYEQDLLMKLPLKQKARLARSLSALMAIAVKGDFYSHTFLGDFLMKKLMRRYESLQKK